MPRISINEFGKGLDSTTNPTLLAQGYARNSQNLLHNRGQNRAELRRGIDRVWATRTANAPVYGLFEYINNAGTITRLCQTNGVLESFSLTPGTAKSTVDTGHQSTGLPRFTQFLNYWLEADARDNNYIGNGTTGYPFQIAAPTTAPTISYPAAGVLNGTYQYDYARYSSVTGELSPAYGTAVPATASNQTVRVTINLLSTIEQFDQVRIYRTEVGTTGPYFEVATVNVSSLPYDDNNSDDALTTLSTIHTTAGASKTDRPAAATDICIHRGRIHMVGLSGARSRQRWSQIGSYSFDSTTDARHDVEQDDGDFLWRCLSFDGSLVLMKDRSIWVMNGDVDEQSFTWQVASPRDAAIGAYCPFTAVSCPNGIIFQGENGIYLFRPGGEPKRISDPIQDELESLNYDQRLLFCGGFDPVERAYLVSVAGNGESTNTITFAYFIDTGYWSRWSYGMGRIYPSVWGAFHTGRLKLYLGSSNGYAYETNSSTGNDGVTAGTETGTLSAATSTTITDSAASFRTTGDGLLGIPATVQDSTGAYQTQEVTSNTGTAITTASWSTTPSIGQTYYVGAIEGILSLGRFDCGESGQKRFIRLNVEFQSSSNSVPISLGFTIDGDSAPTSFQLHSTNGRFNGSITVNRIGIGLSPFIRVMGTDATLEVLRIEIDYVAFPARLPGGRT